MSQTNAGPAWMSGAGIAAIILGVLFVAQEANEWMRQAVFDRAAPASLELPAAECPADELEEEGISVAECEQLVQDVRSYLVSRPAWFSGAQTALAILGIVAALASVLGGALLANYRTAGTGLAAFACLALTLIDAGHFIAAQQAGPILRGLHLPGALLWFCIHLILASGLWVARGRSVFAAGAQSPVYGRFEVASHWFVVVSVFFLFLSSWWMLALPLPSAEFRFREFPFQLHKNLGITILLLLIAMALVRLRGRQALSVLAGETVLARRARIGGHIALYLIVVAVCVTGYLSSSYSGWGTTWWWLIDFPDWGRDDEELNQLFSDWHVVSCWALLLAIAAHIGAALMHAFRNDGVLRRMLRW